MTIFSPYEVTPLSRASNIATLSTRCLLINPLNNFLPSKNAITPPSVAEKSTRAIVIKNPLTIPNIFPNVNAPASVRIEAGMKKMTKET